jgi:hypothetical protein
MIVATVVVEDSSGRTAAAPRVTAVVPTGIDVAAVLADVEITGAVPVVDDDGVTQAIMDN